MGILFLNFIKEHMVMIIIGVVLVNLRALAVCMP
jgi:hypothetical protein